MPSSAAISVAPFAPLVMGRRIDARHQHSTAPHTKKWPALFSTDHSLGRFSGAARPIVFCHRLGRVATHPQHVCEFRSRSHQASAPTAAMSGVCLLDHLPIALEYQLEPLVVVIHASSFLGPLFGRRVCKSALRLWLECPQIVAAQGEVAPLWWNPEPIQFRKKGSRSMWALADRFRFGRTASTGPLGLAPVPAMERMVEGADL